MKELSLKLILNQLHVFTFINVYVGKVQQDNLCAHYTKWSYYCC